MGAVILALAGLSAGCATHLPDGPKTLAPDHSIVFGRAVAVLTGPTTRSYLPTIGFLELENRSTGDRFQVTLEEEGVFILNLPAGDYELTRVQIREGPFMSLANFRARFDIQPGNLTYLGTWRFGVDSPHYGRHMLVSAVASEEDEAKVEQLVAQRFPGVRERVLTARLPDPSAIETRLYEVMPYPRYYRYFRRQNW